MAAGKNLQIKRGIASSLVTLTSGEPGWATDTFQLYIGTGSANKAVAMLADLTNKVVGPSSSTDHAIVRFDGITGKLVADSVDTIDDTGGITIGNGYQKLSKFAEGLKVRSKTLQLAADHDAMVNISGTCAISAGSTTVTGTNTHFLTDLVAGDVVQINGEKRTVVSFAYPTGGDTSFTVSIAFTTTGSGFTATRYPCILSLGVDGLPSASSLLRIDYDGNLIADSQSSIGGDTLLALAGGEVWTQNNVNAEASLYINHAGYLHGSTQWRNLIVRDGKGSNIMALYGSTKVAEFAGLVKPVEGIETTGCTVNYRGFKLVGAASTTPAISIWSGMANAGARNWGICENEVAWGDFVIKQSAAKDGDPFVAGNTMLEIINGGNVGIGAFPPANKLHVISSSISRGGITIESSDVSGPHLVLKDTYAGGIQKFIRNTGGQLQVINDAYTTAIFVLDDGGMLALSNKLSLSSGMTVNINGNDAIDHMASIAADITTTSLSFVNATGLTFAMEANAAYDIEVKMGISIANASYIESIGINGPASPVHIGGVAFYVLSSPTWVAVTTYDTVYLAAQGTTQVFVMMHLRIVNGANAGNFAVRYKTNNVQYAAKIWAGSFLKYRKVASSV